jgi:hypothetical protein
LKENTWNQRQTGAKKPPQQKRFDKANRDIAETVSKNFKKDSIPLKIYLKSLTILEKASICLKKSSKVIEIFIKAHISKQKPLFL